MTNPAPDQMNSSPDQPNSPAGTVIEEADRLPSTKEELEAERQRVAREVSAQFMGALGEKQRMIDSLSERVNRPPSQPTAPIIEEISGSAFLENPMGHINRAVESTVGRLMKEQMAPVHELVNDFRASKVRDNAVNQLRADPFNKAILDAYPDVIEALLSSNKNPSTQDVENAITLIPGLVAKGRLPNRLNSTTPVPTQKGGQSGNIPPSSPPAPTRQNVKVEIELSDAEENIRRRMGWTKERFVELRDNPDQEKWASPSKKKDS